MSRGCITGRWSKRLMTTGHKHQPFVLYITSNSCCPKCFLFWEYYENIFEVHQRTRRFSSMHQTFNTANVLFCDFSFFVTTKRLNCLRFKVVFGLLGYNRSNFVGGFNVLKEPSASIFLVKRTNTCPPATRARLTHNLPYIFESNPH